MTSNGKAEAEPKTVRRSRLFLVLTGLALILALFIGTQVFGVLYGIVFPPQPPLPAKSREMSHESAAYGVDEWLYASDKTACEVLTFYQEQTSQQCRVAPLQCGSVTLDNIPTNQHAGECSGQVQFSVFAMRWDVNISTGDKSTGNAIFKLSREVFWTGAVPPRTMPTVEP